MPTLPSEESVLVGEWELSVQQDLAYSELRARLCPDGLWSERALLGGHPDQIQSDIMLDCALTVSGHDTWLEAARHWLDGAVLLRRTKEWRLLFQLPSCYEIGMQWGDEGCLYYCIHEADLCNRRFDRVWMICQYTKARHKEAERGRHLACGNRTSGQKEAGAAHLNGSFPYTGRRVSSSRSLRRRSKRQTGHTFMQRAPFDANRTRTDRQHLASALYRLDDYNQHGRHDVKTAVIVEPSVKR